MDGSTEPTHHGQGLMKEALAQGDVHIMVDSTSGPKMIMLQSVLYVPELAKVGGGIKRLFSQRGMSSMLTTLNPSLPTRLSHPSSPSENTK